MINNTVVGDIFELALKDEFYDAICIPTNGMVRKDNKAVMGAGLAKQLADKCSWFPTVLGLHLQHYGNVPYHSGMANELNNVTVITFPTKHHWKDKSDIKLIRQSALIIKYMVEALGYKNVLVPQIGTGLGKLEWTAVLLELTPILNNPAFTFVEYINER